MHSSTVAMMPWAQENGHERRSFASRVSGLFGQTNATPSPRATTTFEVPLFLSPTRYEPRTEHDGDDDDEEEEEEVEFESRPERQSTPVIECALPASHTWPRTASSIYSSPEHSSLPIGSSCNTVSQSATQISSTNRPAARKTRKVKGHQRRRRKTSVKRQLQTAKQLSLAFGLTFLLAIITYLILAATGIASGTIFHVVLILLLLILFGIFLHSACRWVILSKRRKARRRQKAARGQWFGQENVDIERGDCTEWNGALFAEHEPEKPIQIIMKEDEVVDGARSSSTIKLPQPPPVYGNFRESKRINPDLVHWKKVPPSPLTPTYAEAMTDVQRVVGYRPPSYIESDCGATQIIETQRMDINEAMVNIHPLHRHNAGHEMM